MYNNFTYTKIWKLEHKKLLCNSISYCNSFLRENNELTYLLHKLLRYLTLKTENPVTYRS